MKAFSYILTMLLVWPAVRLGAQGFDDADLYPEAPEALTVWSIIQAGGWLMIPLGILSFVAVMLVFIYLFTIRGRSVVTQHFMSTADALLRKQDYLGLLAIANRHNEAVAKVVQRTLDFATKNPEADFKMIREVADTEGTRQASNLNQRIVYLADVGVIAPMVGLLGTVIGMIRSFDVLASDIAATRPMLLAEGVSQALVTTAAGLMIGIPALIFYAYFRGQVQKLIADLEAAATQILALLALNYRDKTPGTEARYADRFGDDA